MYRYTVHRRDGHRIFTTPSQSIATAMARRMDPQGFVLKETWAIVTTQQVWPD